MNLVGFAPPRLGEPKGGCWIKDRVLVPVPPHTTFRKIVIEGICIPLPRNCKHPFFKVSLNKIHIGEIRPHQDGYFKIELDSKGIDGNHIAIQLGGCFRSNMRASISIISQKIPFLKKLKFLHEWRQQKEKQALRISKIWLDDVKLVDCDSFSSRLFLPSDHPIQSKSGMNIIGYFRREFGIGESARSCARATQAAHIPFSLIEVEGGTQARANDKEWAAHLSRKSPHPVNIFHLNAPQMPLGLQRVNWKDRYNVGYWHWELPEFPDLWMPYFEKLDEIWTPTHFVAETIHKKSPIPVHVIPHCVEIKKFPIKSKSDFGLPTNKFLFLCMFDFNSYQTRKNPEAALDAFEKAFGAESSIAHFVIKVQNEKLNEKDFAQLLEKIGDRKNISLISETMTKNEILGLENACDAIVSLHRAEGFGFVLAEAMALGKPTIATNWSGNLDFMNPENSCLVNYSLIKLKEDHAPYSSEQIWAEPDIDHTVHWMKKLVNDPSFAKQISSKARTDIQLTNSPQEVGKQYAYRLDEISRMRVILPKRIWKLQ